MTDLLLYDRIIRQLLIAEITHMWPQFAAAENDNLHDIAEFTVKVYERVVGKALHLKVDERRELLFQTIQAIKAEF